MSIERGGKTYFTDEELACPLTGEVRLDPDFAIHLLELRLKYARPMSVNSCCRSIVYNKEIGGHERSLHVYDKPFHNVRGTAAIDIRWPSSTFDQVDLLRLALEMGWSAGVARSFLHLDRRDIAGLPQTPFGYGG
jgi:hypothetical protein